MARQDRNELLDFAETSINDFDTEKFVAAFLLEGNGTETVIMPYLSEQSFTHPTCKEIYQAVAALCEAGMSVDILAIATQLKKKGSELTHFDLMDIYERLRGRMIFTNPIPLALRLKDFEKRRQLMNKCNAAAVLVQDEDTRLTDIMNGLQDFISDTPPEPTLTTIGDAADKVYEIMEANMSDEKRIGTPTGFTRLDDVGGLHPGDLVIVAGDTSNGKTSFALSITYHAIGLGDKVAYYSLEMSDYELTARILAYRTMIPASTLLYQHTSDDERRQIRNVSQTIPRENLYFDDRATVDFDSILASIRSLHKTAGIKGAVVDYIQILNVNNKGRETQEQLMAQVARKLKNLAKELGIWIMALSQLNRNSQSSEPTLARLRDSGQIAEAADVVILIYRPSLYGKFYSAPYENYPVEGTAQIEIAKGRNIGLMKFLVCFDANLTHFYEGFIQPLSQEEQAQQRARTATPEIRNDDELPF